MIRKIRRIFALACLLGMTVGCELNGPEVAVSKGNSESNSAQTGASKSNAISLTVAKWTEGEIVKLKNDKLDEEWFSFKATASTQRIYAKLSTLTDLYVYLYDSNGNDMGNKLSLSGSAGKIGYSEYSLTIGSTYYIKVTGYNSSYTGKYWIGFSEFPAQPETAITTLSENTWENGNVVSENSGGTGEQWFKFVATVSTQYVYLKFSILTDLWISMYDSKYYQIGNKDNISGSSGSIRYVSRSLNIGETYYIKITGYNSSYSGAYWIGFTSFEAQPGTIITALNENEWKNGEITQPSSGGTGEQWFSFEAKTSSQYIWIKTSTLTDLYVEVYDSNYNTIGSKVNLSGSSGTVKNTTRTVTTGETYYIKITGYNSSYYGTYWITFNSTGAQPN